MVFLSISVIDLALKIKGGRDGGGGGGGWLGVFGIFYK